MANRCANNAMKFIIEEIRGRCKENVETAANWQNNDDEIWLKLFSSLNLT